MERSPDETQVDSRTAVSRRSVVRRFGGGGLLAAAAAMAPASLVGAQEGLSEEDATALADRVVGRFNANDLEGLGTLVSPDIGVHMPWPIPGSGADYLINIYHASKIVVPDSNIRIDELLISGNFVTAIATVTGTQTGQLFGFPATGTPLRFTAIFIGRVENGKVAELWCQFDVVAIALQLANGTDAFNAFLSAVFPPAGVEASPAAGAAAGASNLDALTAVPGVAFALEFGADGSVVDYQSSIDIPQEEVEQAAKAGPTLNALLTIVAARYNDISALTWDPPSWVVYSGGDRWTAVLSGNIALIAETATTDFNALAKTLGVTA
jgi:roadblock/LC7 domain-containing protein